MSPETIGRFKQLKELTIDCTTSVSDMNGRVNIYLWFLEFLGHLPVPCTLGHLRLQNRFANRMEAEGELEFWNQVDAILVSLERFPTLAAVDYDIDLDLPENRDKLSVQELADHLEMVTTDIRQMLFPKLHEAAKESSEF